MRRSSRLDTMLAAFGKRGQNKLTKRKDEANDKQNDLRVPLPKDSRVGRPGHARRIPDAVPARPSICSEVGRPDAGRLAPEGPEGTIIVAQRRRLGDLHIVRVGKGSLPCGRSGDFLGPPPGAVDIHGEPVEAWRVPVGLRGTPWPAASVVGQGHERRRAEEAVFTGAIVYSANNQHSCRKPPDSMTYLVHAGSDDVRLLDRELPLECKPRLELLLL